MLIFWLFSQELGCGADFLAACIHTIPEFSRFPAKSQWIFHSVGFLDGLIYFLHP